MYLTAFHKPYGKSHIILINIIWEFQIKHWDVHHKKGLVHQLAQIHFINAN